MTTNNLLEEARRLAELGGRTVTAETPVTLTFEWPGKFPPSAERLAQEVGKVVPFVTRRPDGIRVNVGPPPLAIQAAIGQPFQIGRAWCATVTAFRVSPTAAEMAEAAERAERSAEKESQWR